MSRGKGSKSKLNGRISGYETADFSIAITTLETPTYLPPRNTNKKQHHLLKKLGIAFMCIIVIPFIMLMIIGAIASSRDDNSYVTPKIITPQSSSIKPTAFTQRQLDAEIARDKKIAELLSKEWTMSDGAQPSSFYINVGKVWNAISSNGSSLVNVRTSLEYEAKDQTFETSSLTINLQELKETGGITVDATLAGIFKIYNPSINIESIKSSVQAAYSSIVNSKPYEGSLTFDNDSIYINSSKSGQLINVTISVTTFIDLK